MVFSATRSNSIMSASSCEPSRFSVSPGSLSSRYSDVRACAIQRPVRQRVAGLERLADHRHVGARHVVEIRGAVRPRQLEFVHAVHRHGRPAVRPHRQRQIVGIHRRAGVFPRAVDDVHPAAEYARERPVADAASDSPVTNGTIEWPCVRCSRVTPKMSAMRGVNVDVGRQCRRAPRVRRPARRSSAACGRVVRSAARRVCRRCPSRRDSGRDRCTGSRRCRPTACFSSTTSSRRPNQWSIMLSLAP